MQQSQKISFSEAVTRINSNIKQQFRVFSEYWQSEFSDSYFLWFDNNVTLDKLDLEADNYEDSQFIGYIINGDLNTSKILNYETDYGIHLLVLGNVFTDYMAVGGQDIYIEGNLQVKEIFVGSYNHGTIFVKNNVNCPIVVIDDYSFVAGGTLIGKVYGWGDTVYLEKNENLTPLPHDNELDDIFDDCFLNEYDGIEFKSLVEAIDNNEVLKKYILNPQTDTILPEHVRLISESEFLKIDGDLRKFKKDGDYFFAKCTNNSEELIIQETFQTHKYVISNNKVQIFYTDNKRIDFQEFFLGSNRYRRAKRLLNAKIDRVKYWR